MTKKRDRNSKQSQYQELKEMIDIFLAQHSQKRYSHKQIIKMLGIKDRKTQHAVQRILAGRGVQREAPAGESRYIVGTVDFVNPRYAFVASEESGQDVMVKTENLLYAMDDDTVKVALFPRTRRDGRREGKVVEILKRYRDEFVGRVEISERFAFVVPDFRKMYYDIFVEKQDLKGAVHNDKVVVKITTWPFHDHSPEGIVTRVLGPSGEHEAEMHSIMAEFGLPFEFEVQALEEAEKIAEAIPDEEIARRRDFRDVLTFTIDPEDAKDFDDALSIRMLEQGHCEVGVHIADVTHYVKENSQLEKEAEERATSVYLVDRTVPMLPERLSNGLCSLRPNEDKLTFSAVFELDAGGRIVREWFGRTVIHSDRRFTYEEAQEIIEKLEGDYAKELTLLNELALKLRVDRYMRGAINFETVEVKFELDERGKPIAIKPKVRKDAHKLIEEFMLLANRRVAEFVHNQRRGKPGNTYVYRVHDMPDRDKLTAFAVFARKFGHPFNPAEEGISRSLNGLMEDIEGKPEQNVLQTLAIRSMAKAKYTTDPRGHFGLAFAHYTHFTSPIRRYPDMMSHRLLQHYLQGGKPVDPESWERRCEHSSEMEKRAADAERASVKYKQVEYMEGMIDRDFDGIVSGVTEWGIFVEITETKCEGMIRLASLEDDFYVFEEENFRVVGNRTGRVITLGDDIRVKVIKTDINRRTIDLALVRN